ncbi:TPA: hypothetical protein U3L45_000468 [Streptococcus agalactiae]|nr:hypothetical protein [Streptococcus agalactiae]HEM9597731.1 hypothetical protein [Streptococcus agalactiae]HEM9634624.1 hypothetical protein [Streptococcus agalactiae]HEN0522466.1 hypothetical protein [Streptococcus agalactiae]HEN1032188.1 hypothetical protein [Streptococcus agalactiae]
MEIKTTAQKIIKKIETSKSGLPQILLIMEALIEVEKNGVSQKFRLREFNEETQKCHLDIMQRVTGKTGHDQKTQEALDNLNREITLEDLTDDEYSKLSDIANEVISHFKK